MEYWIISKYTEWMDIGEDGLTKDHYLAIKHWDNIITQHMNMAMWNFTR